MTFTQELWFGIGLLIVGLVLELAIDIARDKWRERRTHITHMQVLRDFIKKWGNEL